MSARVKSSDRLNGREGGTVTPVNFIPWILTCFSIVMCAIFIFTPISVFPGESVEDAMLRLYFTSEHRLSDQIISERQIERLCVEMGDKAIPILKSAIARRNVWRWQHAVECLLYIDSPEVIDILRREYAENPPHDPKANSFLKSRLCLAMSVTTSPQDIEFLINQLDGPRMFLERGVTQSAAFSLAALKADQARPALEKRLVKYEKPEYPSENDDIRLALDHINGRKWNTPQDMNVSHDAVIFAVLRFGIPRTSFSDRFFDQKAWRIWKRQGDTWTHESGKIDVSDFPSISFDVFISSDGNHAMCKVWAGSGPQSFLGHNFILRKENDSWRVIRLMQGAMT